jgi:hypothetical protein
MDKPSGGLVGPRMGEEIRCPSCARLLVLRSGPAITPHYAHRPRQSCRNRPGRPRSSPLRLEQLTLFDLEPPPLPHPPDELAPPAPDPPGVEPAGSPPVHPDRPRRRRRRAWLPRLIRWVKAHRR